MPSEAMTREQLDLEIELGNIVSHIMRELGGISIATRHLVHERRDEVATFPRNTNIISYIVPFLHHQRTISEINENYHYLMITEDGTFWAGFHLQRSDIDPNRVDAVKSHIEQRARMLEAFGERDRGIIYAGQDIVWRIAHGQMPIPGFGW